jgi:undecaprenyl-diphosphatase
VWTQILTWDGLLFLWLREATRTGWGDHFFPWLTDLDNFRIPILVGWLLLMIFGGRRGRKAGILLILTLILTDQSSSSLLKEWVGRIRPCFALQGVEPLIRQSHSPSFPSSHAANSVGGAMILALCLGRWWWSGMLLAGAISFSRVYVGVHYPLDLLGGALLGAGIALMLFAAAATAAEGPAGRFRGRKVPSGAADGEQS